MSTTILSGNAKKIIDRMSSRITNPENLARLLLIQGKEVVSPDTIASYLIEKTPVKAIEVPQKPMSAFKMRDQCTQLINDLNKELTDLRRPEVPKALPSGSVSPLLFLSDLHIGEHVKREGEVLFDLEIAKAQLAAIVDKAIVAPELFGYGEPPKDFTVLLGGDIIDGEMIYPAHGFETTGDVYSQVKAAAKIIWAELKKISKFYEVNVYCVPGNHGRSSKLHSQMSNWDNVLYFTLEMMSHVEPESKIKIYAPEQMWMNFKVRNTNIHTRHIGVVQAGSAGPNKKLLNWILNHDADLIFFGHYHNPEMFSVNSCRVFKNGALPPMNDFAENLGFADGRGQWFVGITDEGLAFSKILQGH